MSHSAALPTSPAGVASSTFDPHEPKGFWQKYIFSHDHKVIGKQFLFSSMLFALIGGGLAIMVRQQIAWPDTAYPVIGDWLFEASGGKMPAQWYNMAFTMHASVMIFLVVIPALSGGFGNYLIPLMIGARDMAFPTLNMLSYWAMWPAIGCFIASFFVGQGHPIDGVPGMGAAGRVRRVLGHRRVLRHPPGAPCGAARPHRSPAFGVIMRRSFLALWESTRLAFETLIAGIPVWPISCWICWPTIPEAIMRLPL